MRSMEEGHCRFLSSKDPGLRKSWLTMTEAPMDLEMGKAKMTF